MWGRGSIAAALAAGLCACPVDGQAEVFRCINAGRAVFQDLPCDYPAPTSAKVRTVRATQDTPSVRRADDAEADGRGDVDADIAGLYRQLQAVVADEQRLQAGYAEALEALRERARSQSNAVAETEVRQLDARWQARRRAVELRRQAVVDTLRRRCPGGVTLDHRQLDCR